MHETRSEVTSTTGASAAKPDGENTSSSTEKQEISVQDVLDGGSFNIVTLAYLITLGFIVLSESMQAGYSIIIIPYVSCEWSLSPSEKASLFSLNFCASGFGAVIIGMLSDRYGRKTTAIGTFAVQFVAMIFTIFTHSFPFYLPFFVLVGFCAGGVLSVVYTYWAEVSAETFRASGVLVITTFWNTGILGANGIAALSVNSFGWRTYTLLMAIPTLIPILALPFLAESPKYLSGVNDHEEMKNALRRIVGASNLKYSLNEVSIKKEVGRTSETYLAQFKDSLAAICGRDIRCETFWVAILYSCLQAAYKGLGVVFLRCLAVNYCGMKTVSPDTEESPCEKLNDTDFVNGMLTASALYASAIVSIYLVEQLREIWTMKILSVNAIVFNFLLCFCLPKVMLFISFGILLFCVNGISVVFFIILPKIYPTVARNCGFGLVDGMSRIVGSAFTFFITYLSMHDTLKGSIITVLVVLAVVLVLSFTPGMSSKIEHGSHNDQ